MESYCSISKWLVQYLQPCKKDSLGSKITLWRSGKDHGQLTQMS